MDDDAVILEIDDDHHEALAMMAERDGMSIDEKAIEIISAAAWSGMDAGQEARPDHP